MKALSPTQEFRWLAEAGLLRAEIIQLPTHQLLQILWHVGRGNLAVGRLYEGHVNALQLVNWFGSDEQKTRYFASADAGELFAVWNTQSGAGVRFEASETGWQMRGAKTFCSGAGHVAHPIVTGELADGGWQMAVVPTASAPLEIDASWWQPLGMRASASFAADFSGTRLSAADPVGRGGRLLSPNRRFRAERFAFARFSWAARRICSSKRGAFCATPDAPTTRFNKCASGKWRPKSRAVGTGWRDAGETWDALGEFPWQTSATASAQMVAFAAMMRVATEEIGGEIMALCEKSVGARGLMKTEPFERITRDLTIYLKQPHLDEIPGRVRKMGARIARARRRIVECGRARRLSKSASPAITGVVATLYVASKFRCTARHRTAPACCSHILCRIEIFWKF